MYDATINKEALKTKLEAKGWTFKELHARLRSMYGFKIGYSNMMELINNNISWKLCYAFAIVQLLQSNFDDLFTFKETMAK